MRVTVLIENSRLEGRDDLEPEFGLSLYVEREGTRILFDTGASGAFLHNAKTMGIDINDVDVAVVSHHHFDHGGGLEDFFAANARATVYLRESPRADRYFKALAVIKKPIGIDLDLLDRFSERIEFVDGMRVVAPGVYLLTAIGSAHRRPRGNSPPASTCSPPSARRIGVPVGTTASSWKQMVVSSPIASTMSS